ncbi:MAG: GNAT family N-acetyltransferase [Planctomycetota bacterium]
MSEKWDIQQPGESERDEAVRVMAVGRSRGAIADARVAALRRYLHERGSESVCLWRAKSRRKTVAAAGVCENPGRTGMLVHSPADAAGVKMEALSAVCAAASDDALERGVSLVQSLELPEAEQDADALKKAGFRMLAELVYMRIATADVDEPTRDDIAWRRYGQFDEDELTRVIAATYEASRDCPALSGVRRIEDVIAGHKAGGVFTPDMWWIIEHRDEPCGCVLVNDTSLPAVSEVVYLGVAPARRGARLGEALVRHACAAARRKGRDTLKLAVDASNTPALRVYEKVGFRPVETRISYIKTAG